MWAGGGGDWSGAGVWRSDDAGHTWELSKLTTGQMDAWAADDPQFAESIGWTEAPAPFGDGFSQVWSLGRAGDRLYAGTKPATLLVSDDDGRTWESVKGLTDHPSAPEWGPGAAGLVLHTIVADPRDPDRMWVGLSAAGVFATEDGGVTWERRNDLADPQDAADSDHPGAASDGHTGFCVHHVERAAGEGDLLYQQNHHGVWRSDDGGHGWRNITAGAALDLRLPAVGAPSRRRDDLDRAAQRRHAGSLPARRRGRRVALARRWGVVAGATARGCPRRPASSRCSARG